MLKGPEWVAVFTQMFVLCAACSYCFHVLASSSQKLPDREILFSRGINFTTLWVRNTNIRWLHRIGPLYNADGRLQNPRVLDDGRLWVDDKIIVPEAKIQSVITAHHDSVLAGRWGRQKTYDILQRKISLPFMKKKVQNLSVRAMYANAVSTSISHPEECSNQYRFHYRNGTAYPSIGDGHHLSLWTRFW